MQDEERSTRPDSGGDVYPRPDPTRLTTEQLWREIAALKEIILFRVGSLKELHESKFTSVERQFADAKIALDAALQAAEKAVGKQTEAFADSIAKSETATTKQIDALGSWIDDVKGRLTKIEGMNLGARETTSTQQSTASSTVLIVMAVLAGLSFLTSVAAVIVALVK